MEGSTEEIGWQVRREALPLERPRDLQQLRLVRRWGRQDGLVGEVSDTHDWRILKQFP